MALLPDPEAVWAFDALAVSELAPLFEFWSQEPVLSLQGLAIAKLLKPNASAAAAAIRVRCIRPPDG
ncbi:MAG: hypothetical protein EPN59_16575 [Paraburkholderia sp.]|nr:MAG: hypothetical protein EPN59_16575 [Paraburkholderia sp.]